ncbi:MAG: DNA-binding protein [Saprospiraceae bacterium]|nr:DNA-binding protein [Saprospiraceae bacterium]
MNITFDELRQLKHSLPHGSVNRIAKDLNREEQEVRNFFGAVKFKGSTSDWHYEPGPSGGIVTIRDTSIFDAAKRILRDTQRS